MKVGDWVYRERTGSIHKVIGFCKVGTILIDNFIGGHDGAGTKLFNENGKPLPDPETNKYDKWFMSNEKELQSLKETFREGDIIYAKENNDREWFIRVKEMPENGKNHIKQLGSYDITFKARFNNLSTWGTVTSLKTIRHTTLAERHEYRCLMEEALPEKETTFKFKIGDVVESKEGGCYYTKEAAVNVEKEHVMKEFPTDARSLFGLQKIIGRFKGEKNGFNWYILENYGNAYTEEGLALHQESAKKEPVLPAEGYTDFSEKLHIHLASSDKKAYPNVKNTHKYIAWNEHSYWTCNGSSYKYVTLTDFPADKKQTPLFKHANDLEYPDVVIVANYEEWKQVSEYKKLSAYNDSKDAYIIGGFGCGDSKKHYKGYDSTGKSFNLISFKNLLFNVAIVTSTKGEIKEVAPYKWEVTKPYDYETAIALQPVSTKKPMAFDEKEFDSKAFNKEYSLKVNNKTKTKIKLSYL